MLLATSHFELYDVFAILSCRLTLPVGNHVRSSIRTFKFPKSCSRQTA